MMIYSYDYEYIALALAASILCAGVLIQVLCIQSSVLNDMEGGGDDTSTVTTTTTTTDNQQQSSSSSAIMSNIKERTIQYVAFRLPFELYTGYIIALVALYFNTFLDTAFSNNAADSMGMVFVIVANVSLVALLGVGYIMLWKKIPYVMSTSGGGTSDGSSGSKRQFYGVGISLVWYLLGVAIELHDPTQPIYNAYTDGAILTTQIVAGVCTTLLMTMLGVRVTKTMIKYNVFNISGLLLRVGGGGGGNGGADTSVFSEESEISTGYVHA